MGFTPFNDSPTPSEAPPAGVRCRPSPLAVLRAPWMVWQPRWAGRKLAGAPAGACWASFGLCLLILAGAILTLALWDATYEFVYSSGTTWPASATAEWERRGLATVWSEWHSGGVWWWGPAEWIVTLSFLLGPLAVAAFAWLYLPSVHRDGSVRASYGRSFRASTAGLGLATVLIGAVYGLFILDEHHDLTLGLGVDDDIAGALLSVISLCLGIAWWGRAITGAETDRGAAVLPPRCEGCGYDLTHQPTDGRCSECGMNVAASLTPEFRRPGSVWMRGRSPAAWLETAGTVLFVPRRFYGELELRSPGSTERGFAGWNYVLIGLGAFAWIVVMALLMSLIGRGPIYFDAELLFSLSPFAVAAGIGCWLGHRVIAAGVVSWWLSRRSLPDGRWAAKVIAYESTFLWVFCAYWGVLGSSFLLLEDWMTQALGRGPRWLPLGMPLEAAVVLFGTLSLGAVWLWRYGVARRAIQWNNY